MTAKLLQDSLSAVSGNRPTNSDIQTIGEWYRAFRPKRDKILHGTMNDRPSPKDLWFDLLVGSEILIAYWKSLLWNSGVFEWSSDDRDRVGRIANVVNEKDISAWRDIISIRTRMALENRDLLKSLYPNTEWSQET